MLLSLFGKEEVDVNERSQKQTNPKQKIEQVVVSVMLVSQKLAHATKRSRAVVRDAALVLVLDILLAVAVRNRLEIHTAVHWLDILATGD